LVATYAAAIREGGEIHGRPIGVLAVFFDWQAQSRTVVEGVRLSAEERKTTRALILDRDFKVIAASDGAGILRETYSLRTSGQTIGSYANGEGAVVGFALTPGYETYRGLGWYGLVEQRRPAQQAGSAALGVPTLTLNSASTASPLVTAA
jgi:hypothetical protein